MKNPRLSRPLPSPWGPAPRSEAMIEYGYDRKKAMKIFVSEMGGSAVELAPLFQISGIPMVGNVDLASETVMRPGLS